jgi:hypothetical protein
MFPPPAFSCDTSSISDATTCCWARVWLVQAVEAVAQLDHRVADDGLAAPDVLVNLPMILEGSALSSKRHPNLGRNL